MLFLLSLCLHQNFDIIELMSLQRVLGNWNTLIVYVGIDCTTAFNNTSFPAWDKNFSLHPCILSQILPFIPVKELTRDLPMRAGNPKYFSYCWVELTLATQEIWRLASTLVLGQKKSEVFSLFSFYPEALSHPSRTCWIRTHSSTFPL